jgi:hypothetical protein
LISDSGLVFRSFVFHFFFCSIVFYSVWWAWFSGFDHDGVGVVVTDLWRQIWCLLVTFSWWSQLWFQHVLVVVWWRRCFPVECECDGSEMEEMTVVSDLKWWLRGGCLDFGKGGVQFSGVSFGGGFIAPSTILVWVCCSGDSSGVVGFFRHLFRFDYGGDSVGVVWAVSWLWCCCVVVIWLRWWWGFSVG